MDRLMSNKEFNDTLRVLEKRSKTKHIHDLQYLKNKFPDWLILHTRDRFMAYGKGKNEGIRFTECTARNIEITIQNYIRGKK